MFPGQGAQEVGMGRELAQNNHEIGRLYQRANEIVGYNLASLCFEGPAERLDTTEISQPGIFVTSAAYLLALRKGIIASELAEVAPEVCLGLSLGEYTALYAAGAMTFDQVLKLVQIRGQSMQAAAEKRSGGMVSIMGLDERAVNELCEAVLSESPQEQDGQGAVLVAVNFNCPGQIVLSGTKLACERAEERAEEFGASRAIGLRVAGAFHSSLMGPAAAELKKALDQCEFSRFSCPVVANVDAQVYDGPEQISDKLMRQLVSAVRWQQSIEKLLDEGVERFVEIGPGRVLTGLVKKISRAKKVKPVIMNVNF